MLAGIFFHGVVDCKRHEVQSETARWSIIRNVPINIIFQQNPFLNQARHNEVAVKERSRDTTTESTVEMKKSTYVYRDTSRLRGAKG